MARAMNFNAGPAALPLEALERAQRELVDFAGTGMSIIEHSHRGKAYEGVHNEAISLIKELLSIPDTHQVLLLQGGASQQFAMVPMNLLPQGKSADYIVTGAWGKKAFQEAKTVGTVRALGDAEAKPARVPKQSELSLDGSAAYVHYTSNETIYGTQWQAPPRAPAPLVCDASSDIFSRPLDLTNHALIFAGAQKNLGPSGVSLVIARKSFIETGRRDLPPLARYHTYAAEQSMHNTPNTFGVFMIGEVVAWIRAQGGLAAMAERNARKAKVLYDFLDHSKAWRGHAKPGSRSLMNVTFRGATKELEETMLARAEASGLSGLRGHRTVGGLRASIYNAFPEEGVHRLVKLLDDVEHGR